jgi:hypothetical protein
VGHVTSGGDELEMSTVQMVIQMSEDGVSFENGVVCARFLYFFQKLLLFYKYIIYL